MEKKETMIRYHEQYVIDAEGNPKAVVLPINVWQEILDALDELEDIRAYDAAKQADSDPIPFDRALSEIEDGMPAPTDN